MKLRINVTEQIIFASRFCSIHGNISSDCAIAKAVRALFPHARVQSGWINLLGYTNGPSANGDDILADVAFLPMTASNFIAEFDRTTVVPERLKITPISFEITIPDFVLQQIDIRDAEEAVKSTNTMQLIRA